MSRNLSTIYNDINSTTNKYLQLNEANHNSSKMSVMHAIQWVVATIIYSFESILDVFLIDVNKVLDTRINGTAKWYLSMIKLFQYEDQLTVAKDGSSFYYPVEDTSKQIITFASYQEKADSNGLYGLYLKVAKGNVGELKALSADELASAKDYLRQIKFAGTPVYLQSFNGDVLVPNMTVYHDGMISSATLKQNIINAINDYIFSLPYDSDFYQTDLLVVLKGIEHVTDVSAGVWYMYQPNSSNRYSRAVINRKISLVSGYVRQADGEELNNNGIKLELPKFDDSITLEVEG